MPSWRRVNNILDEIGPCIIPFTQSEILMEEVWGCQLFGVWYKKFLVWKDEIHYPVMFQDTYYCVSSYLMMYKHRCVQSGFHPFLCHFRRSKYIVWKNIIDVGKITAFSNCLIRIFAATALKMHLWIFF